MGGCFSSSSPGDEVAAERPPRKVWPSDEGGDPTINEKARRYIDKFHLDQSGTWGPDGQQQQEPAVAAA